MEASIYTLFSIVNKKIYYIYFVQFYIIAVHHYLSVCSYSETALEALANHIQSDWVYARVH